MRILLEFVPQSPLQNPMENSIEFFLNTHLKVILESSRLSDNTISIRHTYVILLHSHVLSAINLSYPSNRLLPVLNTI